MKLIFLGTSEFAVPALRAVAPSVSAVVSMPDRPAGRGRKLRRPPAAQEADELGIKLLQPEKLTEVRDEILEIAPDVMVSASYGGWLPEWFLQLAPLGVVNIHPSLLPAHRGAAPVIRTVLQGDRETGVSFMITDSGWDTGDLISVYTHPVKNTVTAGELELELASLAAVRLPEVLKGYLHGALKPVPQRGTESYADKVTSEEAVIRWDSDAVQIRRTVLAFNPVPGARTQFNRGILKIQRAIVSGETGSPGAVICTDPLTVACGKGSLVITELQPQGKKRMKACDFVRGYRVNTGDTLG